jgi:hypothetical protein
MATTTVHRLVVFEDTTPEFCGKDNCGDRLLTTMEDKLSYTRDRLQRTLALLEGPTWQATLQLKALGAESTELEVVKNDLVTQIAALA